MNYGEIKNCDTANGPGVRISLFVSGCTRHCKDCFNSETWDFNYGQPFTDETADTIIQMLRPSYIRGLTILGGEPMEPKNQPEVLKLVRRVRQELPEKDIWCFSGYTLDGHILAGSLGPKEVTQELLSLLDVLVDGPFMVEHKNISLRFRGSENQRLIDMKKTLASGEITLWQDWQSERRR